MWTPKMALYNLSINSAASSLTRLARLQDGAATIWRRRGGGGDYGNDMACTRGLEMKHGCPLPEPADRLRQDWRSPGSASARSSCEEEGVM
jgi:hypothetical protein